MLATGDMAENLFGCNAGRWFGHHVEAHGKNRADRSSPHHARPCRQHPRTDTVPLDAGDCACVVINSGCRLSLVKAAGCRTCCQQRDMAPRRKPLLSRAVCLLLLLAAVGLAECISLLCGMFAFGWWSVWEVLPYFVMEPMGALSLALVLLAVQGVFSGRSKHRDAVTAQPAGLRPGLFLLVWTALIDDRPLRRAGVCGLGIRSLAQIRPLACPGSFPCQALALKGVVMPLLAWEIHGFVQVCVPFWGCFGFDSLTPFRAGDRGHKSQWLSP